MIVTSEDICKLNEKFKCRKASGPDGISAESLSFAHDRLHVLLSLCFSACFSHSYLPKSLLETTIVPVIKNKCCSLTDCDNYRPIAIATITSKLLESIILRVKSTFLLLIINLDLEIRQVTVLSFAYTHY